MVQVPKKITHFSSSESLSPTYKDKDSKEKVNSKMYCTECISNYHFVLFRQKQRIVQKRSGKLLESHLTKFWAGRAAGAGPRAAPRGPCATPWMTVTRTTWCSWSPGQPGASPRSATSLPWAAGRAPSPRPCPGPSQTPSTKSAAVTGAEVPLPRKKGFSLVTCQSRSQARSQAPDPGVHCRVPRATAGWARWSRLPDTRSGGESRVTCHQCRNL